MNKRILLAAVALLGLSTVTQADDSYLQNYSHARDYMQKEKVTITVTVEQAFTRDAIWVMGEGIPKVGSTGAQRRLTATRAAEVAAQRAMVELLRGVAVAGETTIRDTELESDLIRSSVNGFVRGLQPVIKDWNSREETALVILKMRLHGPHSFRTMVYEKIMTVPRVKQEVDRPAYAPPLDPPLPPPVDQPNDGLIIDATSYAFRPALVNRIFNPNGEVLYDPTKISQRVLVEQGCGEYSNSVDKARAALRKRGVNNPLVVIASGSVSQSDLQVSHEVAIRIFSANKINGFMADARVAFVLK